MNTEIDVSSFDMGETLRKDRRRRREAELCKGMSDLDAMLLPLALAVARMSARAQAEKPRDPSNKED